MLQETCNVIISTSFTSESEQKILYSCTIIQMSTQSHCVAMSGRLMFCFTPKEILNQARIGIVCVLKSQGSLTRQLSALSHPIPPRTNDKALMQFFMISFFFFHLLLEKIVQKPKNQHGRHSSKSTERGSISQRKHAIGYHHARKMRCSRKALGQKRLTSKRVLQCSF